MWPLNSNSFPQWFSGNQNPFTPAKPNSNFSNAFAHAQPQVTVNTGVANTTSLPWGNDPFVSLGWPVAPEAPKEDWTTKGDYFSGLKSVGTTGVDKSKDGYKPLTGSGSINGNSFKTGSGETWTPAVKAGQTYNLLSDGGVGLNGTFMANPADKNEVVLGSVGLKVGDSNITFSSDGTLLVDGEKYSKSKNSLKGLVSEKDGTVTVKTNEGYTFTLKARGDNGIKVDIKAENVGADGIAPQGLWGAQFDGEKQTERDLRQVKARDFEIKDDLTFDYEDNNALTNKKTLDDEDRGEKLFNGANPKGAYVFGVIGSNFQAYNSGEGLAEYTMNALKDNKFYSLFSDEDFQLSGKFVGNKLDQIGGMIGDKKLLIEKAGNGVAPKITLDGKVITDTIPGVLWKTTDASLGGSVWELKFTENGEDYQIKFGQKDGALTMYGLLGNQGENSTRSTGLLGDALSNGHTLDNKNDANGAGYLRNADGLLSKPGEKMSSALAEYMVDDLYDTDNGRSVYD